MFGMIPAINQTGGHPVFHLPVPMARERIKKLSGTQLVNIAEEMLTGNPDDIQCRGETTSELKGMQMIHIDVRNIILYYSQRATLSVTWSRRFTSQFKK